ncbi:MAG TPA: IS66 family insertion sequence element accessory protein TnpB [Bryobacteraceae bacterium]|nr:IS66 family insertion sequence element accessory protein TnpB [Bryobacteraceae bacterium]
MITVPTGAQIWIAAGVTDLRRGFTGLSAAVQTKLEQDPFCGHVFVFRGRRGDLIKILWWGVSRMQVKTCRAVLKMGEGLPGSAFRSRLQTARSCCAQKAW